MNIQDSEDLKKVEEFWFDFLLARQKELVEKYKDIEKMPSLPMDINTSETQIWIKDFFWRVTEELMEAAEANNQKHEEHYLEELSDALHFYLEIFVLLDHYPVKIEILDIDKLVKSVKSPYSLVQLKDVVFEIIYHMGLAANMLRNKKWKQTQVFVDKDRFFNELYNGFQALIELLVYSGISCKYDLLNLYYKKFQVNQFRQRSQY